MAADYRPIPGYPGYFAGSDGSIYSAKHGKFRKLKPAFDGAGRYMFVNPCFDGKAKPRNVHRLVCMAWHGEPAEDMVASHLNGDRSDNRPENLIWETQQANLARRVEHGTDDCGVKNTRALFDDDQITHIRERIAAGHKLRDIAKDMGCDERAIGKIKRGERYAR